MEDLALGLSHTLRFILNHPMNKGRPISTLVRFAKWQVMSRLKDEIIVDWIDGAKLAVRRGMTGATGNIYCGLHEYVDMRFVIDTLTPDDLFIDIGANVGSYTVLASKVRGAQTISIEPDPTTLRALRRNVEINEIGNLVQIVETALGARDGNIRFTVGKDTVNRVAMSEDHDVQVVSIKKLDDVLEGKKPTIIKIDVEGYEAEVFKGASQTLAEPGLKAIITETLDRDILRILEEAGFRRAHYDPAKKKIGTSAAAFSNNSLMVRGLAL